LKTTHLAFLPFFLIFFRLSPLLFFLFRPLFLDILPARRHKRSGVSIWRRADFFFYTEANSDPFSFLLSSSYRHLPFRPMALAEALPVFRCQRPCRHRAIGAKRSMEVCRIRTLSHFFFRGPRDFTVRAEGETKFYKI